MSPTTLLDGVTFTTFTTANTSALKDNYVSAVTVDSSQRPTDILVGTWVGVWGGRVTTGWHFWDPHDFGKLEPLFGTHEAKFLLKKWVTDHKVDRVLLDAVNCDGRVIARRSKLMPGFPIETVGISAGIYNEGPSKRGDLDAERVIVAVRPATIHARPTRVAEQIQIIMTKEICACVRKALRLRHRSVR